MRSTLVALGVAALFCLLLRGTSAALEDERHEVKRTDQARTHQGVKATSIEWYIAPVPRVCALAPRHSSVTDRKIKELVRDLVNIDRTNFGLTGIRPRVAFTPLASHTRITSWLADEEDIAVNQTVRELVALGPWALPVLLQNLDNQTPTKLEIRHGGMWPLRIYLADVRVNPANTREADCVAKLIHGSYEERFQAAVDAIAKDGFNNPVWTYRVKVGDVCFDAIGQITNRRYAAEYSCGKMEGITSPCAEANVAKAVRSIWATRTDEQSLLNSLLLDFSTRGPRSDDFQTGAALRLLYYFPEQASPLIANRLRSLDASTVDQNERTRINGIFDLTDLIHAVSWSDRKEIRAEILRIFQRTTVPQILMASLRAMDRSQGEAIYERSEYLIGMFARDQFEPGALCFELVTELVRMFPQRVDSIDGWCRGDCQVQARVAICKALDGKWSSAIENYLVRLLSDTRPTTETYPIRQSNPYNLLPVRVCDHAAVIIAARVEGCGFKLAGTHEQLNRQILVIKSDLALMRR